MLYGCTDMATVSVKGLTSPANPLPPRSVPGDEGVVDGGLERVLGVLEDVEEDELEKRSSASEDVVVQPDGTRSNALRVEPTGEVVSHAEEIRVEYDEEYVQCQDTDCRPSPQTTTGYHWHRNGWKTELV